MAFSDYFKLLFSSDFLAAANYLGVSSRTVRRWESGSVAIPLAVLKLLHYEYLYRHNYNASSLGWSWSHDGRIQTPYGLIDAYQVEMVPIYESMIIRQKIQIETMQGFLGVDYNSVSVLVEEMLLTADKLRAALNPR